MKLYELSDDYRRLLNELDSEDSQHNIVIKILSEIKTQFDDKAVSIAKLTLSINADIETVRSEVTRLSKRSTALENKASWLKE